MRNSKHSNNLSWGFTLIELLIVVAIIAILAAIAVPNFLEAQTRAKVSRSKADMRSIITGIESYRVDFNKLPIAQAFTTAQWWGFTPPGITTPIAYMTSSPRSIFKDTTWIGKTYFTDPAYGQNGNNENMPYFYIYDTGYYDRAASNFFSRTTYTGSDWATYAPTMVSLATPYSPAGQQDWGNAQKHSSYFMDCSGPDNIASAAWRAPVTSNDPTNGTISFGDIPAFGTGTQSDSPTGH